MKSASSLCIDLGAAFTKIAVRTDPNKTTVLLADRGQNPPYQICIPSLAASQTGTGRWAFGWEVLGYRESDSIKLHQNWKAKLFAFDKLDLIYDISSHQDLDPAEAFLLANDPFYQALSCCREFLKSLKAELIPLLLSQYREFKGLRVGDFDTRICVPDFVLNRRMAEVMETIMTEAGFSTSRQFCISEPVASLIGILTEGQNHVSNNGSPNMAHLIRKRDLLKKLTASGHGLFFVDIGAFTTDLALANLSPGVSTDLTQSLSVSLPLGLIQLDSLVQSALGEEFSGMLNAAEPRFREDFHQKAYNRTHPAAEVRLRDDTLLDVAKIEECLDAFAESISKEIQAFFETHQKQKIHAAVLTGGGNLCNRLSSRIAKTLAAYEIPIMAANQGQNVRNLNTIPEHLIRGASAIGGASILYSF